MAYRKKLNKRSSKKLFSSTAKPKSKNRAGRPMRGGIRL